MDTITISDLKELAERKGPYCLSMYLPTHVVGDDGREDRLRLEALVERSEEALVEGGLRRPDAREFLAPIRQLPLEAEFWQKRGRGLAILRSPNYSRALRLTEEVEESLTLADRFAIKSLLPLAQRGEWFYLLTLSQNLVRLFEVTRRGIEEVPSPSIPTSMHEALNYASVDRGEQVHSAAHGVVGKQGAVFHGQGGEPDALKSDLTCFFQAVDRSLTPLLEESGAPLLLAGVSFLPPIYRKACSYAHVSERDLLGNWDHMGDQQLFKRSWEVMTPWFDRPRREAEQRLIGLLGTGRASTDVAEIVSGVLNGKVETLFADARREQWGTFDAASGQTTLLPARAPGGEDLINLAISEALLHGGTVFPMQPSADSGRAPLAATYRY
ncbi:MAG: hypothetical protein MUF06_16770 [Pirellulaceae bacterium]|jgi:hypothetical protein|nr:hypothetical protein [Pirellulaceae bacterium]